MFDLFSHRLSGSNKVEVIVTGLICADISRNAYLALPGVKCSNLGASAAFAITRSAVNETSCSKR
jgi:hypothetical protein